jgi:hypothetical protein
MSKPFAAEERVGLGLALVADEAEVGVDDLDGATVALDLGPQRAAPFAPAARGAGQFGGVNQLHGEPREDRVAKTLLGDFPGRVEMIVHHQFASDDGGLIHAACAGAVNIEFLERDDVGAGGGNDPGDARGRNRRGAFMEGQAPRILRNWRRGPVCWAEARI